LKTLTDKGINYSTFPTRDGKRFGNNSTVLSEFKLFNSIVVVCQVYGIFDHNTHRLLDFIISYWAEIVKRNWLQDFNESYPTTFKKNNMEKLIRFDSLLRLKDEEQITLHEHMIDHLLKFKDYIEIEAISDRTMRSHPALKSLSSKTLYRIIDNTAHVNIKTRYPIHIVKNNYLGWYLNSRPEIDTPFSKLLQYRLLEEKKAKNGRVIERVYRFKFTSHLNMLMIHNTICGGTWNVNPNLYCVSGDAQLLYRCMVIGGSRRLNNSIEFISHRMGWKEKQAGRQVRSIERLLNELINFKLLKDFEIVTNGRKNLCHLKY